MTDDVNIIAFDRIFWIDQSERSMTEVAIRKTSKTAGFEILSVLENSMWIMPTFDTTNIAVDKYKCIKELNKIPKWNMNIGDSAMSANDVVISF